MSSKKQTIKLNKAEIRFYELVGIRFFRKLMLLVERIRHFRDKGRNENYHPKNRSHSTLVRFSGYQLYNAMFHVVSLIFVAVYFGLTRTFSVQIPVADIIMIAVIVLDVYCIILQRYIFLRFRQRIISEKAENSKARAVRVEKIAKKLEGKSFAEMESELALIMRMREYVMSGKVLVITPENEAALTGIADVCAFERKTTSLSEHCDNISLKELALSLPEDSHTVSAVQRRVLKLQKLFRIKEQNRVLFGACIITGNADAEQAYNKIFTESSLDNVEQTLEILCDAYQLHRKETVCL